MGTELPRSAAPSGATLRRKIRVFIFIRSRLRELDEGGRSARRRAVYARRLRAVNRRNDDVALATDDVRAHAGSRVGCLAPPCHHRLVPEPTDDRIACLRARPEPPRRSIVELIA